VQVEQDLMRIVPRSEWILFAHLIILHGRRICVARKPRCGLCPVQSLCPSAPYFLRGGVPPRERAGSAPKKRVAKPKTPQKRAGKPKTPKKHVVRKRPPKKAKRR
jgi:adenine-specific DNA glycosylase